MRHPVVRRGCAPGRLLLLQFGNRRVHLINLFIELIESVLRFAQLTGGFQRSLLPAFSIVRAGLRVVVALAYRALFRGDIGLNRFELVTLIRVGGKGAQQYASAKNAGVDDGPDCKPARFHGPCHGINRLSLMGRDYSTMNSGLPVISCGISIPISDNMVGAMSESLPPATAFTFLSPT